MSTTTTPAHPEQISKPDGVSVEEVHEMIGSKVAGVDFLIVDVRRTDIEGDANVMIPTAINLPAQTFHATLPALFPVLSRVPVVIFHCSASNGRGPRCASWYQDSLDKREFKDSKAMVLTGGLKAWREKYGEKVVAAVSQ